MSTWDFLTIHIALPFVGMISILLIHGDDHQCNRNIRQTATWIALLQMIVVIFSLLSFAITPKGIVSTVFSEWFTSLEIHYYLQLNGLNILFIGITTLMNTVAIYLGKHNKHAQNRLYYTLLLLIQGALNILFTAVDYILFLAALETILLSIFVLLAVLIGKRDKRTILELFASIQIATTLIAIVFLIVKMETSLPSLNALGNPELSYDTQLYTGILFMLAVFMLAPVSPFHGWFISIISHHKTGITCLLLGIFPTIALHLCLVYLPVMFPTFVQIAPAYILPILAVVAVMYVCLALVRRHKEMNVIAYLYMSQVLISLAAAIIQNPTMNAGAVFLLIGNTASYVSIIVLLLYIWRHGGQTVLDSHGGLINGKTPYLFFIFSLFVAFSMYLPGSLNFIGLFIVLKGAFQFLNQTTVVMGIFFAMIALTVIIASGVWITFYRRLVFGRRNAIEVSDEYALPDITGMNKALFITLILSTIVIWTLPWVFIQPIMTIFTR